MKNEIAPCIVSINSREVAEMVGKEHKNLLLVFSNIRGHITDMEELAKLKIQPSDFFIESTYRTAILGPARVMK